MKDYIVWPLFFIFLFLKLTGFIDWSWYWVTAPIWGNVILVIAFVFLEHVIDAKRKNKRR